MRRSFPSLAVPFLAVLLSWNAAESAGTPTGPADCLARETAARTDCLHTAVMPGRPDRKTLDALRVLAETDAADVERLLRQVPAIPASDGEPIPAPLRADLLEIRADALGRLGRHSEAVSAARAAVEIDDGATRLTWRSPEKTYWSTVVDPGMGRLARAARILAEAGETRQAREWLQRSLAAGAGADARRAWDKTGGGPTPPLEAESKPLTADEWFPPLPDLTVRLHGGGEFELASARGKVLLIDFWASWCAPCLRELPALQTLADHHRDAGLVVLTINARETKITAESTFRSLGVKLPLGVFDDALDRAFSVRTLPTMVLADRQGRIRARWDARVPDVEAEVNKRVLELLSGATGGGATRTLAEVTQGESTLAARWTRELSGVAGGIVFLPRGGADAMAVTAGDQLTFLDATGKVTRRSKLNGPPSARVLSLNAGEGKPGGLLFYQPGRDEVLRFDPAGSEAKVWKLEAPVLAAAVLSAASPPSRVVVVTAAGAGVLDGDGALTSWPHAPADSCAVAALPSGRVVAASRAARLEWLDPSGRPEGGIEAGGDPCGPILVRPGDAAVGVTPSTVRTAAVGRFLSPRSWHAALATGDDQLVVVSLESGAVVFRARWKGISAIGAGDLDGDGIDELLVADGRRVTLLGAPGKATR